MTSLNVVQFPDHYAAINIPESLRILADQIEAGEHGASRSDHVSQHIHRTVEELMALTFRIYCKEGQ